MSEKSWNKTSWNDNELSLLCNPGNHKIISDGYDFRWYHNINSKWGIHSIETFKEFNKAYSWLKYWLYKWNEELTSRRSEQYKQNMTVHAKIYDISVQQHSGTYKKVLEIHKLDPDLSKEEIGEYLGISVQMVRRYFKRASIAA